jgi:hypothetical protein
MDGSNSIINLGELSKPANTLIEKISEAIGGIFKPYQIRRVAQAEAQAEKIKAITQIEISELQHRALYRFMEEEAKKQYNIESITQKALPEVKQDATPEKVEDDWITNFFDKCRLISDEEMQTLWAKVLSGEANSPGNFSKRTVDLLSSLDKSDAELFSKLCSFAVRIGQVVPLIYDTDHDIYTQHGITFSALSHLESIGLLRFDSLTGFLWRGIKQNGFILYYGKRLWIEFPKPENNEFQIGKVLLSKAGRELAPICDSHPRDGFPEYLKEKWKTLGYKTDETSEQQSPKEKPD